MATNKQRIQAYIDQQLFDCFEADRLRWNVSQSQALERILAERYNAKVQSNTSYPILEAIESQNSSEQLTRLEAEIRGMVTLNHSRFEQVFNRLNHLEGAVTQLLSSESSSELPSESSGELSSESSGELPSKSSSEIISGSHPFFDRFVICNLQADGEPDYWTGEGFSCDIRQGLLYSNLKRSETQAQKLQSSGTYNIKIGVARNLLTKCLSKDSFPYSLEEIFRDWQSNCC